jgi:hypothetical protein
MRAPGVLRLCGLGTLPEETAAVDALHALGRCDALFVDGSEEDRRFVADWCPGSKPRGASAAAVLRALKRGLAVGLAARGGPIPAGGLSASLLARCRREGIACEIYGAVSSVDESLAALGETLGGTIHGVQVYGAAEYCRSSSLVSTRQPVAIGFDGGDPRAMLKKVLERVERAYGGDQKVFLLGPGKGALAAETLQVQLKKRLKPARPWMTVWIPAKS